MNSRAYAILRLWNLLVELGGTYFSGEIIIGVSGRGITFTLGCMWHGTRYFNSWRTLEPLLYMVKGLLVIAWKRERTKLSVIIWTVK